MTIQNFYKEMEGDYEEVLARLMTEDRVNLFINRFFEAEDLIKINTAIKQRNGIDAFEFSHRLKGNALNIGFNKLARITDQLVEPLRSRHINEPDKIQYLYEAVAAEYDKIHKLVSQIE